VKEMHTAIETILSTIPKGYIFDSHFIITQLIKNYSDIYLDFASTINPPTNKTLAVHGKIGQEIAIFGGTIIRKIDNMSWSENIHGNSSECTAWQKI
jgi:hypothetical protein